MLNETNPKDALGSRKPDLSLVPPASIIHEALAMENGATKYGPYNWRTKKVRATVYIAAATRHLVAYLDGENYATDSGIHHLAHAKACCGILLDAIETSNLIDDRPPVGAAARLLQERGRFPEKTISAEYDRITQKLDEQAARSFQWHCPNCSMRFLNCPALALHVQRVHVPKEQL